MEIKSDKKISIELECYMKAQTDYNETGDKSILWDTMYPILVNMLLSSLKKQSNNNFVNDIDDKAKDGAIKIISRYIKNQKQFYKYPKTAVYWCTVGLLYGDLYDRFSISLDDENNGLENEANSKDFFANGLI